MDLQLHFSVSNMIFVLALKERFKMLTESCSCNLLNIVIVTVSITSLCLLNKPCLKVWSVSGSETMATAVACSTPP